MKKLKKQFEGRGEVKGYTFKQLSSSPYAYIYEVSNDLCTTHYEVFKHKENTYYNCISYPTSKGFGLWAWTKSDLTSAEYLFDELNIVLD